MVDTISLIISLWSLVHEKKKKKEAWFPFQNQRFFQMVFVQMFADRELAGAIVLLFMKSTKTLGGREGNCALHFRTLQMTDKPFSCNFPVHPRTQTRCRDRPCEDRRTNTTSWETLTLHCCVATGLTCTQLDLISKKERSEVFQMQQ